MPWDRLPEDFEDRYESAWTLVPNSLYDPEHGHHLYNRYLDELVLSEDLGFDGVLGSSEEAFDAQVLLDPFEEQFDLPA